MYQNIATRREQMVNNTPTFEQMMALFKETRELFRQDRELFKQEFKKDRERAAEIDKRMDKWAKEAAERSREAAERSREAAERSREADERMQRLEKQTAELNRQMGGLHNSLGALVEAFLAARIETRFPAHYGLRRSFRNTKVYNDDHTLAAEIDILLSNGELAVIIEVKRKAEAHDVERFASEQMKIIQANPPAEARGKKLMAGFGFMEASLEARKVMEHYRMFAVELSGEAVNVSEPSKGSPATEW
jgi:chromosome segregation ATPase